ncbi:hypothetical protein ACTFIR_000334 [Dictyostelium discoideum]
MNVGDKEFKVYTLNDGKYLDMSTKRGTLSKFLLIQEYLHDVFTEGELDGVIIKRNLTESKFDEFEEKYRYYKVEYVKHGGLVIIYENLSTGIAQFYCTGALIPMFERVNSFYVQRVLNTGPGISISLLHGSRLPNLSLLPDGRQSLVPTTVVEVGVSQSITHLVKKCASFFRNTQIEIVLGIKIFSKEDDNTFRAAAFYYSSNGLIVNCLSIASFGSVLSSNQVLNNSPNTPPFVINIPLATLLNGASPQPEFLPNLLQEPINAPN